MAAVTGTAATRHPMSEAAFVAFVASLMAVNARGTLALIWRIGGRLFQAQAAPTV